MYNATTLQQAFAGLIGFFQPYDPAYPNILPGLTTSTSGRVVQMAHPLCNLEVLYNVAPEFKKFDYPAWAAQAYSAFAIVSKDAKIWRTATALLAAYPAPGSGAGSENWVEQDKFSIWLGDQYNAAVIDMVNFLIRTKKLEQQNRQLINSLMLYDGLGSLNNRIITHDRFVGFEIAIGSQEGLMVQLLKIGIQLDTALNVLPMYLYHSSVDEPILTFNLEITKPASFSWQAVNNCILKFYDDDHDTSGVFYLGYYERDLGVIQAIRRDSNWGTQPCMGCNEFNLSSWRRWSKHMTIQAISVDSTGIDYAGKTIFDQSRVSYDNGTNWGLNLHVSVFCDMTDFFIQFKEMFAPYLEAQLIMKLLAQIAYSTRINSISDKTKALAMADLDPSDKGSFAANYKRELEAASFDMSGFSSECLPCNEKGRITYSAV